jgi:threonine aldolase
MADERALTMIDLYSDTMTKPTPAMRKCMAEAEVGDEQKGEDPTVNRLQEMVAELLGKEAAVYLPSGTMCNEISFAVWARTGDEMIIHRDSHPVHFEVGGPAYLARLMAYPLDGPRGLFTSIRAPTQVRPYTGLGGRRRGRPVCLPRVLRKILTYTLPSQTPSVRV